MPNPDKIPDTSTIDSAQETEPRLMWGLLLVVFAFATCLAMLSHGPQMGDHECINAVAARQTIENGHFLVPQVNGAPWVRKPPLGTWLIAATAFIFERGQDIPVSDWSARLPSAIAGVINALAVWWLGRMLFGARTGLVAGFIAAGSAGIIFLARNAQVDMVMTAFTTLSFACFWRGCVHERPARWAVIGFYVALAFAMLAKAPLPLAIEGGALFLYWFVTRPLTAREHGESVIAAVTAQARRLSRLKLLTGGLLFAMLFGAWPVYIWKTVPDALELWRTEYVDRASGDMSEQKQAWFYYLPLVLGLLAPYTMSVFEALAAPFLSWYRREREGLLYAFTWAVFGTVFLSIAAFKRPHYLLAVLPAYVLLLAPVIDRLFFGIVPMLVSRWWVSLATTAAPIGITITAIVGGVYVHREFPTMLRSYAMIAAAGVVLWTASALLYRVNRRGLSFAFLNMGTAAVGILAWSGVAPHLDTTPEALALATEMKKAGISNADEIIWVGKRPKATIEFYANLCAKRLINEMELAGMRRGRANVSDVLLEEYKRRIQLQLQRSEPVYLIMQSGYYYWFEREVKIKAQVVIELHGYNPDEPGEDLIVVTQPWNTGKVAATAPASQPATTSAPAMASRPLPKWHPDRSAPRSGFHFTCHQNNAGQNQRNAGPLPN